MMTPSINSLIKLILNGTIVLGFAIACWLPKGESSPIRTTFADFGSKEFLEKVRSTPLAEFQAVSKNPLDCQYLESRWNKLVDSLKNLPPRSPLAIVGVKKSLMLLIRACGFSPGRLFKFVVPLTELNKSVLNHQLGQASYWAYFLPEDRGFSDSLYLSIFDDALDASNQGLDCGVKTDLYSYPHCFGLKLYEDLVELEKVQGPSHSVLKLTHESLAARVQQGGLTNWWAIFEVPFANGFNATQFVEALLSNKKNLDLIGANAKSLARIIASTEFNVDCRVLEGVAQGLVDRLDHENSYAMVLGVGIVSKYCSDAAEKLIKRLQSSPLYRTSISDIEGVKLLDLAVHGLDEELTLRGLLGLKYNYGASFDLSDLRDAAPLGLKEAATDHILAQELRQMDGSPWVRQIENIENITPRVELNEKILTGIHGSTFLQLKFLERFDLPADSGEFGAQETINQIRLQASRLAGELPQMMDFAFEIHNNLHRGLIENLREIQFGLNRDERTRVESQFVELFKNLQIFFQMTSDPEVLIRSLREKVYACDSRVGFEAKSLGGLLRAGVALMDSLEGSLANPGCYLEKLRILKAINAMVNASLGDSNIISVNFDLYSKYISQLIGVKPAKTALELSRRVSDRVQSMFGDRLKLFRLCLFLQSKRLVQNQSYYQALSYRQYGINQIVEKLIRESGLQQISKFDQQKNLKYRAMNTGEARGILNFVDKSELGRHAYNPKEILVTNGLPLNLGVTAALITEVYQPLASHVDLRTRERGTPNAYLKGAADLYEDLIGKPVHVVIGAEGIKIKEIDRSEIGHLEEKAMNVPEANLELPLVPVDLDSEEALTTIEQVGAKAYGYAHLRRLFGPMSMSPKAYALPFSVYQHVVDTNEVGAIIHEFLRDHKKLNGENIEWRLRLIRKSFKALVQSQSFLQSNWYLDLLDHLRVHAIQTISEGHGENWSQEQGCFRFRSSTNSEDLIGFTGAGLYESKTGCLQPESSKKTIAAALGKVLGSLWTYRAFSEREHFGIDHSQVKMAVLMHRNFKDEAANGVLLSRSRMDPVTYISVAPKDDLVTNPSGTRVGDEMQVTLSGSHLRVVNQTIAKPGSPILNESETTALADAAARAIHYFRQTMSALPNSPTVRMDMEFKFMNRENGSSGGRRLYIKQARPYLSN